MKSQCADVSTLNLKNKKIIIEKDLCLQQVLERCFLCTLFFEILTHLPLGSTLNANLELGNKPVYR